METATEMYTDTNTSQLDGEAQDRWLIEPMVEVASELQVQSAWTWRHLGRVARYAVAFGKKLGLDTEEMLTLHCAAVLHDIGKLVVPNELLDKATPLSRDEWYTITKHSMVSGQMLKAQTIHSEVARVAQSHHEWYNGKGYPLGLEEEAIPLGARILAIADSYDAMSSNRPYRRALEPEEIRREFDKGTGTQFDPHLVERLTSLLISHVEDIIPQRRMRILSDDPMLYQQLWFAAYPQGWDLEPWPPQLAEACPAELRAEKPAPIDLTIIDCRCMRRLPEGVLSKIRGEVLWIDPVPDLMATDEPAGTTSKQSAQSALPSNALHSPLDLRLLMPYLDKGADWSLGSPVPHDAVKIIVADPFKLFRQALTRCFDDRQDVQIVETADSPDAYRQVLAKGGFDVAVVASDFMQGTHTTRPLHLGDTLIGHEDLSAGFASQVSTIVLVADEDIEEDDAPICWEPGQPVCSTQIFIPRGSTAEVLLQACKAAKSYATVHAASSEAA